MENNIQHIELINQYLNKELSANESEIFLDRLKTDSDFKNLYEEHLVFLEGLKRQTLKAEIRSAKRYHIKMKWFKYVGLLSIITLLITAIYFSIINSDKDYLKSKLNFEAEYLQKFQVAVDSIVKIIGEKGTVIQFNPKDLQTISNKPFFGDMLQVELIELTTKQDLLIADVQTISNGKWLISGGAFKIDIKANGESLVLKEGNTINVKFPKNTSEDDMLIFYGEREKEDKMNWSVSKIDLQDKKYFTIVYKEVSVLDFVLSKKFGIEMYKDIIISDTLGYMIYDSIFKEFPEIEELKTENDTLRICDVTFFKLQEDSLLSDSFNKKISISKIQAENLIKHFGLVDYYIDEGKFNSYDKVVNNFYESIEVAKLGWINIDKFAPNEEKVNVKFNDNLYTNYNEIYIVDERNNTVLNVFENEIDIPVGRSFYIIAIGIKGKDIYGYKKSVRFEKNGEFNIEFKRINETQIKSILKL